jgi:hypothetical protein
MWFVPDITTLESDVSAKPGLATLAQTKIRSDHLTANERDMIADLFTILETLVVRDELPAEARCVYDQAVLMIAQRYE